MKNLKNKDAQEISKIIEDAWLNIRVNEDTLYNPLESIPEESKENPHLYFTWLLTRTEYISFVCSQILNVNLLPYQAVILRELWHRKFPMLIATRGGAKTYLLAVYCILRCLLLPGRKVIVAGAGFRQSKMIYDYCTTIWNNAPILRDSCGNNDGPKGGTDAVYFNIGDSRTTFIPIGPAGDTIRGYRAQDILADEFSSHNQEIFEHVIAGFGAVASSPQEKVIEHARKQLSKNLKIDYIETKDKEVSNQIVISGTAYYHFNHFAQYWEKWKKIIHSYGDLDKLNEIFGGSIPEDFDWKDYSIIRLPYNLLPKGYMDAGNIARSKATLSKSLFQMEFDTIFSKDSDGFYKATLIENATANSYNKIEKASGVINFFPKLSGDTNLQYYMGVDTASQVDNFAITILEIQPDHRRIVYCWTTNAKDFKEKRKTNEIQDTDFFKYCIKKIRLLMTRFNITKIAIDSQGGGRAIYEGLHDKDNLQKGEQLIWEVIDTTKKNDSDAEEGLHIVELINFAKQEYNTISNNGMKKDFEDRNLLFPEYNNAVLAFYDSINNPFFIEMEDCILDIEELKVELTKIMVTITANGRERFDTPEIKVSGSAKGRDKKDRYTSLLMANMSARTDFGVESNYTMKSIDNISEQSYRRKDVNFIGPSWITSKLNNMY